jgi:hypothetical protein
MYYLTYYCDFGHPGQQRLATLAYTHFNIALYGLTTKQDSMKLTIYALAIAISLLFFYTTASGQER